MAAVSLRGIGKYYGDNPVVHGIDLDIADGEFVALVGPSGCGKTTLLRMIAGLESISAGELRIGGERANELPPQQRHLSMVFQSYAFGPELRGEKDSSFRPRIEKVAQMLDLQTYLQRLPRALSGGQRQRVAMARAIVREPRLFLFDEPLSNLDAKMRMQMRTEIKALHQRLKNTVVYVTHDQIEAMTLADRIVVINHGRIEQVGSPLELYDHPANRFVAGFIGSPAMNFIDGTAANGALRLADGTTLPLSTDARDGQALPIGVRPEHLAIEADGPVTFTVEVVEPTGAETHLYGHIGDTRVCITERTRLRVAPDERLRLAWPPQDQHVFDAVSGLRMASRA